MKVLRKFALLLLMLPLLGADTCTEEKLVNLSIGFPTTATFLAEGNENEHFGTDVINVKEDIDLREELKSNGINPDSLDADAVKIARVFYRVIEPDDVTNRMIVNGELTVQHVTDATGDTPVDVDAPPAVLVTGFSAPAGKGNVADPTAWVEITDYLDDGGVQLLNSFLEECIKEIQGKPSNIPSPWIKYTVEGDSTPDEETNFLWEIKVEFQGRFPKPFDVPFGRA